MLLRQRSSRGEGSSSGAAAAAADEGAAAPAPVAEVFAGTTEVDQLFGLDEFLFDEMEVWET